MPRIPQADLDCYSIEFKDATADVVLARCGRLGRSRKKESALELALRPLPSLSGPALLRAVAAGNSLSHFSCLYCLVPQAGRVQRRHAGPPAARLWRHELLRRRAYRAIGWWCWEA